MFLRTVAHCYEENANQETGSAFFEQGNVEARVFSVQNCPSWYLNSVDASEIIMGSKGFMHKKGDFMYKSQRQNKCEHGTLSSKCLIPYRLGSWDSLSHTAFDLCTSSKVSWREANKPDFWSSKVMYEALGWESNLQHFCSGASTYDPGSLNYWGRKIGEKNDKVWGLNDPEGNTKTNQLCKTKLWVPRDQGLGLQGPASLICSVQN